MTATVDDVKDALSAISPDCGYGDWFRIAAAIYSALGDDGFDVFDEWSRGSKTKYRGRRSCKYQWDHSKRLTKITVGTLFYYAEHGL